MCGVCGRESVSERKICVCVRERDSGREILCVVCVRERV